MEIENDQENINSSMLKDPKQRKRSYRNLLSKVERIHETEDVGLKTVNKLGEVLRDANRLDAEWKIEDRVEHADETLLDCLVLVSASTLLKKCIQAVDVFTSTYEQSEYSDKIVRHMKSDEKDHPKPTDLSELIEDARCIIPEIPKYNYVYGTYNPNKLPQPVHIKERLKVNKEKLQKKEPHKVTSLDKDEEGIEEIVKVLQNVLITKYNENGQQPVKYYDYIIDTDFAITVENMFYFAFLIRDGKAQIDLNRDGSPVIKPIKKNILKTFRGGGGSNTQVISYVSVELWQRYRKDGYLQQHRQLCGK